MKAGIQAHTLGVQAAPLKLIEIYEFTFCYDCLLLRSKLIKLSRGVAAPRFAASRSLEDWQLMNARPPDLLNSLSIHPTLPFVELMWEPLLKFIKSFLLTFG